MYVSQTGRKVKVRIKEHQKSSVNGDRRSAFTEHLIDEDHSSSFDPRLLHVCDKGWKLDFLEKFEILAYDRLHGVKMLNDVIPSSASPLLSVRVPPPPSP